MQITNDSTTVTQNSRLVDVPDPSTGLLIGSVTTDQGTVILGNGAGNTSVEIDIGEILPMATVIVEFEATVISLNTDTGFISNQAIYSDNLLPSVPSNNPLDPDNTDTRTPVDIPNLTAEKSAILSTDVDMDGKAGANDVIEYSIDINNTDDDMDANGATLIDFPDANTTLAVGSVVTSQGTVISGNTAGDTSVEVNFGSIPALGGANVTFEVAMPASLPEGLSEISNQGMVTGSNFPGLLTDDVLTMAESDPTITPVTPQISFETPNSLQVLENGSTLPSGDSITLLRSGDLASPTQVIVSITGGTATGGPAPGGTDYNNSPFPLTVTFGIGEASKDIFLVYFNDAVIEMTETILLDVAPSMNGVIGSTSTFTVNILDDEISATKDDAVTVDADGDGIADPGDTVRFTVVVTNSGVSDLQFTSFTDTPGTSVTNLVVGSVTTSQGVVLSGNSGGDTEVDINLGTISPMGMGSVTISYDVLISNTVPDNLLSVFNQGTVRAGAIDDLPTDDPDTPSVPRDPTETFFDRGGEATFTKGFFLVDDPDCNLRVSPGDTLQYSILFSTAGDSPLLGGTLTDALGDFTSLIVGSVALADGTIVKGNTAGDTTIEVTDFNANPGSVSQLVYSVRVDSAPPPGNQRDQQSGDDLGNQFRPHPLG